LSNYLPTAEREDNKIDATRNLLHLLPLLILMRNLPASGRLIQEDNRDLRDRKDVTSVVALRGSADVNRDISKDHVNSSHQ